MNDLSTATLYIISDEEEEQESLFFDLNNNNLQNYSNLDNDDINLINPPKINNEGFAIENRKNNDYQTKTLKPSEEINYDIGNAPEKDYAEEYKEGLRKFAEEKGIDIKEYSTETIQDISDDLCQDQKMVQFDDQSYVDEQQAEKEEEQEEKNKIKSSEKEKKSKSGINKKDKTKKKK